MGEGDSIYTLYKLYPHRSFNFVQNSFLQVNKVLVQQYIQTLNRFDKSLILRKVKSLPFRPLKKEEKLPLERLFTNPEAVVKPFRQLIDAVIPLAANQKT